MQVHHRPTDSNAPLAKETHVPCAQCVYESKFIIKTNPPLPTAHIISFSDQRIDVFYACVQYLVYMQEYRHTAIGGCGQVGANSMCGRFSRTD